MHHIKAYHRPETVQEALQLLSRSGVRTTPLAGGISVVAGLDVEFDEVVDLQSVGLDQIIVGQETITIGSMVRIQQIVEHPDMPPLVKEAAHREGPNTFRNIGSLGGVVVGADWESELFAALLVHQAQVSLQTLEDQWQVPLSTVRPESVGKGLLTKIVIQRGGRTAFERVARTPADKPIVAVAGRKDKTGVILLAICGVAGRPVLTSEDQIRQLNPPADFRGSSDYRRQMALTLSRRVLDQLID